MGTTETALILFGQSANCGQSVICAFGEKYGISPDVCMRLAGGLGGGMRVGEVCGALSGAVLVVGARYGATKTGDIAQKDVCNEKTREVMERFREMYGHVCCRNLLKHSEKRRCREFVAGAVAILNELGY